MKVTKRPKKIKIEYREATSYIAFYTCPTCHVSYRDGTLSRKTTQFRCDCGQELKVENNQ